MPNPVTSNHKEGTQLQNVKFLSVLLKIGPPSLPAGSSSNVQHYELQSLVNKSIYDETKVVWNHDKQLIEDLCNKLISNLQNVQSVSERKVMINEFSKQIRSYTLQHQIWKQEKVRKKKRPNNYIARAPKQLVPTAQMLFVDLLSPQEVLQLVNIISSEPGSTDDEIMYDASLISKYPTCKHAVHKLTKSEFNKDVIIQLNIVSTSEFKNQ